MSWRYRRLKQIQVLLHYVPPGDRLRGSRKGTSWRVPSLSPWPRSYTSQTNEAMILNSKFQSYSFSSTSQVSNESSPSETGDILSFIESNFDGLQGPNHCWLNVAKESNEFFQKDGTLLILAGDFVGDAVIVAMLERVKSLQQRFPWLRVFGFHFGSSSCSTTNVARLVEVVMKEFITFPILTSKKSFTEMENGACYILSKDLKYPYIYHEKDLDPELFGKAIGELHVQENRKFNNESTSPPKFKSTWYKQAEVIKEPILSSPLQNLLLHFPGCISADESGGRLFLSDSNHHRIIILDDNGNILDCIGSGPGFEDGEFDSAKLLRPASTFYHEAKDCLYIVDSENHAIRRADMDRRVLETLYPTCSISKNNKSVWTWILEKLPFGRKFDVKSNEFNSRTLLFPWHLLKSEDNSFLITSHSFENLWIMDVTSGEIKQFIRGYSKVMETCGQLIMDKISLLKQIPSDWLQHQTESNCSQMELPCASLISGITTFQNHIIVCDSAAQRLLKLSTDSGACSNFKLSNFGILGLPYWLSFPLERVFSFPGGCGGWTDHLESLKLLPGRIAIQVNVSIPVDTELVESLQEGCIWRQARGAATEIHGAKDIVGSLEKVGVAQQWYDELDDLAFTTPDIDIDVEVNNTNSVVKSQDDKIHIDCAVNTSPGTSEVIIYAALYLKLRGQVGAQEDSPENNAARIADILKSGGSGGLERDSCVQFLLQSGSNLRDLVFIKPLHVRIKLDSLDHPKADNLRDIILTNSSIEVDVSLNT